MSAAKIDLKQCVDFNRVRTNLAIDIRTDWTRFFIYLDDDGAPADNFASWVFACEIRNDAGTLIATPTGAIVDVATGTYSLALPLATTTDLTPGTYNYDVLVTVSGQTFKLQYGQVEVVDTVTQ